MEERFELCPKLLRGMALFATEEVTRYNLAGLSFRWDGDFLEIVASDGNCLSVWGKRLEDGIRRTPGSAIVPIHGFRQLLRDACKKKNLEEHPKITVTILPPAVSMQAFLATGFEVRVTGVLPDGDYPDWRKVIPEEEAFRPIPKVGMNVGLLSQFHLAARYLGATSGGIVGLRFTQETGVMEVKLDGIREEFTGYLMPARMFS